jgi:anti-anti-sigma regulatory factor
MFVLAGVNHRVQEVLELTRLDSIFPLYPDEAAARDALKQGRTFAAPHTR